MLASFWVLLQIEYSSEAVQSLKTKMFMDYYYLVHDINKLLHTRKN